jgi:hypothetical protein
MSFICEQVVPGELSVVTGVPNSGKSEWIDALLCNLNRTKGWTFALCSMENKVLIIHFLHWWIFCRYLLDLSIGLYAEICCFFPGILWHVFLGNASFDMLRRHSTGS